jgi:hypothetical protein
MKVKFTEEIFLHLLEWTKTSWYGKVGGLREIENNLRWKTDARKR